MSQYSLTRQYMKDYDHTEQTSRAQQQEYQIEPFQIQPKILTNAQIQSMIDRWGVVEKIQEKFALWDFSFTLQKLLKCAPENFYKVATHYVFLKKLQLLVNDFSQNDLLLKSMQLKEIYQLQSLKGKLKGQRFDYLLIVTVKLISFFLGSHTQQIIISKELESQIYAMLIFVLLGTQVGEKAYFLLTEKYKKKPELKYSRSSQTIKDSSLPTIAEIKNKTSQQNHHKKKTAKTQAYSKQRVGRIDCRHGTDMFRAPKTIDEYRYREMRELLRANLQVREFIPKPKVKQSLDAVLGKAVDVDTKLRELDVAKRLQKEEMTHKKIGYTQMSSAMDLLGDNNALKVLQNHSLKIKPQKQAKFYQLKKKQDIILASSKSAPNLQQKLPKLQLSTIPEVYSYQAMVLKKKRPTYWKKIITEMKQNHLEDIGHFPPINVKMYFKQGELDDDNKRQSNSGHNNNEVQKGSPLNHQDDPQNFNYNSEYITQRIVDLSQSVNINNNDSHNTNIMTSHINQETQSSKLLKNPPPQLSITHKKSNISHKSSTIEEPKVQPKNEITVTQYSKVSNDNNDHLFKADKSFLNIYSNKPINDFDSKLKKKSFQQLKQLEKKFYEDCKIRQQKIQQSYFS